MELEFSSKAGAKILNLWHEERGKMLMEKAFPEYFSSASHILLFTAHTAEQR